MMRSRKIVLCFVLSILQLMCVQTQRSMCADRPTELIPTPSPAELTAGIEKLKKLYVAEYLRMEGKANVQGEQTSLARKLLKTAKETPPDNVGYYPMLSESIRLATLGKKAEIAFDAIATLAQTHAVDTAEMRLEVFKTFTEKDLNISDVKAAGQLLPKAIQDAADAQRLDQAIQMVHAGEQIANRIIDQSLAKKLLEAKELLGILKSQELKVAAARKKIETAPDDPSANLSIAKFVGMRNGEWEAAEKYAARINEDSVRSLFVREISAPQEIADVLQLANDWWDFGDTQSGAEKLQARELAASRYETIVGKLTGFDKRQAETRLASIDRNPLIVLRIPSVSAMNAATSNINRGESNSSTTRITSKATGMTLTLIPKGTFQMGIRDADSQSYLKTDSSFKDGYVKAKDEQPQHDVEVSQFYMGMYEVTQGEYEKVMGTNPSHFSKGRDGSREVSDLNTARFPVERVSWYDAIAFCNTLSEMDELTAYYSMANPRRENGSIKSAEVSIEGGTGYRLPTEAEWEYACRGTARSPFHFGGILNVEKANINGNKPNRAKGKYLGRTKTVGSYAANKFGLFDMHGNVWEWCFDVMDENAYGGRGVITIDPVVTSGSNNRALRGGGWVSVAWQSRSTFRGWNSPDFCSDNGGFRIVR